MKNLLLISMALLTLLFTGCDEDENSNPTKDLTLNIAGLEDLGSNAQYEGWLIVDGSPITTGTFTVDGSGNLSENSFTLNASDIDDATTFVLTVEPLPDSDPAPSDVHILAGDFSGGSANLTVGHGAAIGDDFSGAAGNYILATPTNGDESEEYSGIWFLDLTGGSPAVGLTLPNLPAGWKYEGWTVIDGQPVTTGTFTAVDMMDEADPFSGPEQGPPFPGEDFLMNAPAGLTFPTDIRGGTAVISIEPDPDNSPAPFVLKPLVGSIDADAMDHVTYDLSQNLVSFPTGTVTR